MPVNPQIQTEPIGRRAIYVPLSLKSGPFHLVPG